MAPAGWFGKIASLGDFASRRLPPEWVQACDGWLSGCVASSRQQLGEQWLQAYLSAPAWRFAWAPGVVDAQWWFGVLMPSCDSVGRYFPLVVAQARAAAPLERFALDHLDLWWARAAQAATQTLQEGADVAAFEWALAELPPWPSLLGSAPAAATEQGEGRLWLPPGTTLVDLAQDLAARGLQQRLQGHSLWWPWRPPQDGLVHAAAQHPSPRATQARIVPGLPAPQAFAQMLSDAG